MPKPIDNNQPPQVSRNGDVSKSSSSKNTSQPTSGEKVDENSDAISVVIGKVVENNQSVKIRSTKIKTALKTKYSLILEDINKLKAYEEWFNKLEEQVEKGKNSIEND